LEATLDEKSIARVGSDDRHYGGKKGEWDSNLNHIIQYFLLSSSLLRFSKLRDCQSFTQMGESDALQSIATSLDALRRIAGVSPDTAQRITRDLQRLYDCYSTQLSQGRGPRARVGRFPHAPFDPTERREPCKYKNTRAWRELVQIMGQNLRITGARKAADLLSRNMGVLLSAEVRNHADLLMGWFDLNWAVLSVGLASLATFPISS
jgi:hypothetical protein